MDVLILGQGGREHAIAWNLSKSSEINTVFVIPGNAGTFLDEGIQNVDIDLSNHAEIIKFVKDNNVHLTIVGPEAPLVDGIVDKFNLENSDQVILSETIIGSQGFCFAIIFLR